MASTSASSSSSSSGSRPDKVDPVLRNALRYTVSAKEYKLLHQYLISRAPVVRKRTPPPPRYEAIVKSSDDYSAAAIRASLRVGVSTYTGLKIWEFLTTRMLARGRAQQPGPKTSLWKSPNVRLSCSLSLILLFHRLLHRFFTRLRESLLTDNAKPFRRRNPRVSRTLTSRLAPAIGASLSGFFLGIAPSDQLRISMAIYVFTRALEFIYNDMEDRGYFENRPWWFGSWMIMPAACGQLFHAFVFDRDCFPSSYTSFVLKNSPQYIQQRPPDYPAHLHWPNPSEVVDNLAEIARLRWPPFTSPILFPTQKTLPPTLTSISPVTSPAHPLISSLSCALLHPHDPSCLRTHIAYYIQSFPRIARLVALIYSALSLARYKAFLSAPIAALNRLAKAVLRMSLMITGMVGTAWGSVCLLQQFLPRTVLPTQRFFFGGFLAGLWAFLERKKGRSNFLYAARLSIDSLWKVGVKHGWWRGVRSGDVLLFVASLMAVNAVYEANPEAVCGAVLRKGLGMLSGEGWVDRTVRAGGGEKVEEREDKATGSGLPDEEEKDKTN